MGKAPGYNPLCFMKLKQRNYNLLVLEAFEVRIGLITHLFCTWFSVFIIIDASFVGVHVVCVFFFFFGFLRE
jgi:hypothetical protein